MLVCDYGFNDTSAGVMALTVPSKQHVSEVLNSILTHPVVAPMALPGLFVVSGTQWLKPARYYDQRHSEHSGCRCGGGCGGWGEHQCNPGEVGFECVGGRE